MEKESPKGDQRALKQDKRGAKWAQKIPKRGLKGVRLGRDAAQTHHKQILDLGKFELSPCSWIFSDYNRYFQFVCFARALTTSNTDR